MSSVDQRMDIDADEPELQRNCKEESALSEIPRLAISDPAGVSLAKEKNLFPITPEIVQALYSEELPIQLEAVQKIRKLLAFTPFRPIDQVIKSGTVPRFVHFLNDTRYPELQYESAWALTNLTCGTPAQTQAVIDAGAVPVLSMLLSSPNENVITYSIRVLGNIACATSAQAQVVIESGVVPILIRLISFSNKSLAERSVRTLGNIAFHSTGFRDLVLNSNVLPPLLGLFRNDNSNQSLMRIATLTLRNLCDKKPPPNFEQVSQCLPLLARLMFNPDEEILENVTYLLFSLCGASNEQIQVVLDSGVCPRAVQLLSHTSNKVVSGALFLVCQIAMGTYAQTQVLIKANAVPALGSLLSHKKKSIVKNACRTLTNIMTGNEQDIQEHIQAVIDAKLLPSLVELLHHGDVKIRREAAWIIHNVTSASDEQIACLVDAGAVAPFCQLLTETDSTLFDIVLFGLERILLTGESFAKQAGSSVNPYATMVKNCGGLEKMTLLSSHNDPKIKDKASTLIEMYLSTALVK